MIKNCERLIDLNDAVEVLCPIATKVSKALPLFRVQDDKFIKYLGMARLSANSGKADWTKLMCI